MSPDSFELVRYVGRFYLFFLDRNLRDVFSWFFYDSKIFSQNSQVVAYGNFLPVSRIVLFESFSSTPRFSTEFSQFSQFFCSLVELRTFSVKKFWFFSGCLPPKCFLAVFAGFFHLLLLRCCRWEDRSPHFSLGCPQNSRVFFLQYFHAFRASPRVESLRS